MALATLGVKYKSDKRDQYLHHGNWMVKLGLWLLFSLLPFFFPNGTISLYGGSCTHTLFALSHRMVDLKLTGFFQWFSVPVI